MENNTRTCTRTLVYYTVDVEDYLERARWHRVLFDNEEAATAFATAQQNEGYEVKMRQQEIGLLHVTAESGQEALDEIARVSAIAKLNYNEKRVLGLLKDNESNL